MSSNDHKGFLAKLKIVFGPPSHRNRGLASTDGNTDKINHDIEQHESTVNDPKSSEEAKRHAREELEKLGVKE